MLKYCPAIFQKRLPLLAQAALAATVLTAAFAIGKTSFSIILFCIFMFINFFYIAFCFYAISVLLPKCCRGKAIGIAYACGALGTYLLGLFPDYSSLLSPKALFFYLLCLAASLHLYFVFGSQIISSDVYPDSNQEINDQKPTKLIFALLAFALLIFLLNGVSGQIIAAYAYQGMNVAVSRSFLAIGFILAGFLADKNRMYAFLTCILALTFSFVQIILFHYPDAAFFASAASYLLAGFFSLYPFVIFTDFSNNNRPYFIASLGILAIHAGDMISYIISGFFILANPVWDLLLITVLFLPLLLAAMYIYRQLYQKIEVKEKIIEVMVQDNVPLFQLDSFGEMYGLTAREKEVLLLIIDGLTASKAAQKLLITERTIKAHLSSIYRKTGTKNRYELLSLLHSKDKMQII
jgi:DNA-binding CsgD family transcriptional regulator